MLQLLRCAELLLAVSVAAAAAAAAAAASSEPVSAESAAVAAAAAVAAPAKRQRERNFSGFSRYAPREPSCEQLRAMWKLSRRQHRNAVLANAVPRYQEPLLLGRVQHTLRHNALYGSLRPPSPASYGTVQRRPGSGAPTRPHAMAMKELVDMRPASAAGGRRDTIRQLVQMFGRSGEPAPQGLTGNYGRMRLAPRPRKAAGAAGQRWQPASPPLGRVSGCTGVVCVLWSPVSRRTR